MGLYSAEMHVCFPGTPHCPTRGEITKRGGTQLETTGVGVGCEETRIFRLKLGNINPYFQSSFLQFIYLSPAGTMVLCI